MFGPDGSTPFVHGTIRKRARRAWAAANLQPTGLHEARHSTASTMIAAGINAKAITTYLGHSSIQGTFDLYGHLMPGNEEAAAAQAIGSTRPGGHVGFIGYQHVELSTADLFWSQVHRTLRD